MATNYPAALDTTTQLPNDQVDGTLTDRAGVDHPAEHVNISDAIRAIQAELGINPSGTFATVIARLNARQTCRKTADQSIATTTATNITDMVLPIDTTGIDYRAVFEMWYVTGGAGVIQIPSIVAPTVGGHFYTYFEATVSAAPTTASEALTQSQVVSHASNICTMGAQLPASTTLPAAGAVVFMRATCVLSNPTATGTLQLRSQLETGTTSSAFKRGSWGELVVA